MFQDDFYRGSFIFLIALLMIIRLFYQIKLKKNSAAQEKLTDYFKEAQKREGGSGLLIRSLGFFSLIAIFIIYPLDPVWLNKYDFPIAHWLRGGAICSGIASLGLLIWVHNTLGKYWSMNLTVLDNHRLITTGPYKWIRHPMYTALIVFMASVGVLSANWLILIPNLLAGIMLSSRTKKEEAMLIEYFGEEYQDYMLTTGKIFPKV